MTWIDVADSAVKIGLGALLSGAFAYLTLKKTQNHEHHREYAKLRSKLVEEAASQLQIYCQALKAFVADTHNLRQHIERIGQDLAREARFEYLKKTLQALNSSETSSGYHSSIAIFSILALPKGRKLILEIADLENEIRGIVLGGKPFDDKDWQNWKTGINERYEAALDLLATEMERSYK